MEWHSKSGKEVLDELKTDSQIGLTEIEARSRLVQYGYNKIQGRKRKSVVQLFIAQLKNWLIYVLLFAVIITIFMGEYVEAIIILIVIILNAVLGVIQEVKAGKAI